MRVEIISFTDQGSRLNASLKERLPREKYQCTGYAPERFAGPYALEVNAPDLKKWVGSRWGEAALVFVGAAGIAVRMIAPYVKDKFTDSAVVAVDERGQFVIPLLSGHIGGAVQLARDVAEAVGGTAVITTATDVQEKFAVDVFAGNNHLWITDRRLAKEISAAVLEEKRPGLFSEWPVEGAVPPEIEICRNEEELSTYEYGILIGEGSLQGKAGQEKVLQLIPKNAVVGIGCRRGIPEEKLEDGLRQIMAELELPKQRLAAFCSIDLKKEEPGICGLSKKYRVPFVTFSAEELKEIECVSSHSAFVERITGVDNVCERAVKRYCRAGSLLMPKRCMDGMTFSVGLDGVKLRFQ